MVDGTQGSHRKEGSTKMSKISMVAAGIDTGKRTLDVALHGRKTRLQVENTEAGHGQLVRWLRRHKVGRVGIEASGGYEKAIVARLRQDGFTVVVFQPRQVRAYADFRLQRAKNDQIDAELIAACTAEVETIREAPDPRLDAWIEHLTLIEQVEEDIARLKTRREATREPRLRQIVADEIRRLKTMRRVELKRLRAELDADPEFGRRLLLAMSVDGIGERTAIAFVVRLPELGTLSREQVVALVGLAPFDDDSAGRQGQRHIAGGRQRLRKSVYAAALPAAFQWNPALIAFYKHLRAKGKQHKVALVAVARKLVIYVNTVIARGTPWVSKNVAA